MSEESRAMRAPNALRRPNKFIAYMRKYWFVYMLVLPGLVFMLVFDYGPMYGILLAFKDYSPRLGVWGSPWAGLSHFILNAITLTTGILTSLMSVIGISSIILQYDFLVISCAFIGVGISCMCSIKMKNLQYKFKIESVPYNREINYIHRIFYLHEYIKEIITFSNSRVFEKKYQAAWSGMNKITNKWGKRIRMQYISIMLIDSITEIFILIYLGYNTIFGKIPIGEFIVLYTGIQQMIQQMKAVIASVPEIYSNALDLEKYFEFMNRRTREGKEEVNTIEKICFENVNFSYGDSNKDILHNINFSIGKNNKRIALVGKNGSGA